jgi:hypothetical protein
MMSPRRIPIGQANGPITTRHVIADVKHKMACTFKSQSVRLTEALGSDVHIHRRHSDESGEEPTRNELIT